MPTLALLDGNSIAYRAFYALPEDLATKSGQVTNAVFGFTRMLIRMLKDFQPDGVAVAWDVSRETFRTEQFPEYKANRTKAPDHFRSQLPLIDEVLQSLQIGQLRMQGYEADDIIASLAKKVTSQGWDVLIVTGDRDAFQLVRDPIRVVYTRRGISDTVLADSDWIEERYGIPPSKYTEYAALRGDNSDNLPGVPGVGEKTASRLIAEYGTLETVYESLDDLTPKLRENLAAARDQVFLNRRLMVLIDDLELEFDADDLAVRPWDRATVKDLFDSLEFHSMWDDLQSAMPSEGSVATETMGVETDLVNTGDQVAELASRTSLTVGLAADDVGIAVSTGPDTAAVIPWESADPILDAISAGRIGVSGHDLKPLARALLEREHDLVDPAMDTALAAYILNPSQRTYGLGELAERMLGLEVESPDAESEEQGMLPFDTEIDLDREGRRIEAVRRLAEHLERELTERDELDLFRDFELPLVPVLARMEHAGIGVDREYLIGLGDELRARLVELEKRIVDLAGEPLNVNSTDQLRTILFDKLGLPILKKTSTGKPSTDASVLKKMDHPLVDALLEYREFEKIRSTYVDGYLPLVGHDGRIHTRFNQMAATTGRLSSDSPNLQNIPVRSDTGKTIRRAFVAAEGHRFLVADYSQIELRVLAHMSGDPFLVDAFLSDMDVHTATAARVWSLAPEEVSANQRRTAKMINFGLLYGMEAFGLADRLDISRDEARDHIDAYFSQFQKVKEYMSSIVTIARNQGYTTTLFGRRRYLPELKSDNFRLRQMGERMALNAPIQGTAADIIKKAMIDLDAAMHDADMLTALLLQVHDELIFEVPDAEADDAEKMVVGIMEGAATLSVPLRVDVAWGANLSETKS